MKKVRSLLVLLSLGATAVCGISLSVGRNGFIETNAVSTIKKYAVEDPATYYSGISGDGQNLLDSLNSLNSSKRKSTVGYKAMLNNPSNGFYVTDPGNGPNTITTFYSGKNNNGTGGLNREHVWPDSRGGNLVEGDIHMPRPTLTAENGSRGNSFYVEGKCKSSGGWDPAMEDFGLESYRGDSARIIFYCAIANKQLTLVDKENDSTGNKTMGKLSDLLKWNLEYPVLEREMTRNDGAQSLQGNRNPFIDHPEYACKIWGNTNDATKKICSSQPQPVDSKKLLNIELSGKATKTTYNVGERFDISGLTITAIYDNEGSTETENVTSKVTVTPATMSKSTTSVTISYSYNGVTKSVNYSDFTVNAPSTNYGTLEEPLTPTEALAIMQAECLEKNSYTNEQMYCKGVVKSFDSTEGSTRYKKVYVTDNTTDVYVYSLNMTEDQFNKFKVGDTITFHGFGCKYGDYGTYEFSYKSNVSGTDVTLDYIESPSIDVESVEVNAMDTNVFVGDQKTVTAIVLPEDASDKTLSFTTSDSSIATVDQSGVVNFLSAGSVTITVSANNGVSDSISFNVSKKAIPVSEISASIPSSVYYVGDDVDIYYEVSPSDADNKQVNFTSSNSNIASVNQEGNISFKAVGNAIITIAACDGSGVSTKISVSVQERPVTDIPVEDIIVKNSLELDYGQSSKINYSIEPENATDKSVKFTSSDKNIVTVDKDGNITAINSGSAIITITSVSNSNVSKQISVTVKQQTIPVESINADNSIELEIYQEKQIEFEVLPNNASDKSVTFTSSNKDIVMVDQAGNIEGVGLGTAIVTIKSNSNSSVTKLISVTVREDVVNVTSIVAPSSFNLKVNEEKQIEYQVLPENATDRSVQFTSSDTSVVSVSATGLVKAVNNGSANIIINSISNKSVFASISVVVQKDEPVVQPIVEIVVSNKPTKTIYNVGESFLKDGLVVEGHFANGTSQNITNQCTVTAPDLTTVGVKTVSVKYGNDLSTSFDVVVSQAPIIELKVEKLPAKINYFASEEFNPIGLKVTTIIDGSSKDITDIVTFKYDFTKNGKVTIECGLGSITINVNIESGTITNEHKAADFTYVFEDKLESTPASQISKSDWDALEYYFNSLDSAAQKVLKEYAASNGGVSASTIDDERIKSCISRYDEIYLANKDNGFKDFMSRNPQPAPTPDPTPDPQDNNKLILILVAIGAAVIVLVILIVVIAVKVSKKNKKLLNK